MHSLFVLTFMSLLSVGTSIAAAQTSCDEQYVVSQVDLAMTTQLPTNEQVTIRARLIGHCFSSQQVGELADRVRDTLQTFGYFRATASEPAITIVDGNRHPQPVSVKVRFAEGSRYRVSDVIWSGTKGLAADQLFSISLIRPADILDTSKVQETVATVRRLYAAVGYPAASIVPQIEAVEDARHLVRVRFSVMEGIQSP